MIQRIQSVWLFLASLTIFSLLLIPVVSNQTGATETWIMVSGLYQKTNGASQKLQAFLPLLISTVAVGVMCFAAIFCFRNRTMQKRVIVAAIAMIGGLSFWIFNYARRIPGDIDNASYGAGAFIPVLAILFCLLALRGIRKDEQLLRSADRLR